MKKVEANKYKVLKEQRKDIFNLFRKALFNLLPENKDWAAPVAETGLKYGMIGDMLLTYYNHPEIHSELMDKIAETVKKLSAEIELMHPKQNRAAYEKDRIEFQRTFLTLDLVNSKQPNVMKYEIDSALKNLDTNSEVQKVVYLPFKNFENKILLRKAQTQSEFSAHRKKIDINININEKLNLEDIYQIDEFTENKDEQQIKLGSNMPKRLITDIRPVITIVDTINE